VKAAEREQALCSSYWPSNNQKHNNEQTSKVKVFHGANAYPFFALIKDRSQNTHTESQVNRVRIVRLWN